MKKYMGVCRWELRVIVIMIEIFFRIVVRYMRRKMVMFSNCNVGIVEKFWRMNIDIVERLVMVCFWKFGIRSGYEEN